MAGQELLAAPLRASCPSSTCPGHTHTKYFSPRAENLGNSSFFFLTCDLWSSSVASGPLFCFKVYPLPQVKLETLAWQEKRRCSLMWPFLATRKGHCSSRLVCGVVKETHHTPSARSCQDTPEAGSTGGSSLRLGTAQYVQAVGEETPSCRRGQGRTLLSRCGNCCRKRWPDDLQVIQRVKISDRGEHLPSVLPLG